MFGSYNDVLRMIEDAKVECPGDRDALERLAARVTAAQEDERRSFEEDHVPTFDGSESVY